MTLKRQLMLVSLLLLTLPWAGCQFVREIEGALRQGQAQSLQATARAVATVIRDQPALLYSDAARLGAVDQGAMSLYAPPTSQPLIVDGYADGWAEQDFALLGDGPQRVAYQAATRAGRLYLLLRVSDPHIVYHNPALSPEANGDRLLLTTWVDGRRQEYAIASAAPGAVRGRFAGRREPGQEASRIRGYWQDSAQGYTLELVLPLAMTGGRLGLRVIDISGDGSVRSSGNLGPLSTAAPPWLIRHSETLQTVIAPFDGQAEKLQVVDRHAWLVGESAARERRPAAPGETFWLLRLLYRSILEQEVAQRPEAAVHGRLAGREIERALAGQPATAWYRHGDEGQARLAAAEPVYADGQVIGAVVAQANAEQYLSLTDAAFGHLLGYSLLALGLAALGLLGYASLLSWRIGRLGRAAANAIGPGGELRRDFPRSRAADELGELSRSYARLLEQLREYNDYLRSLSRKLSHELRTPVAVIRSSLDNLEAAAADTADSAIYLERARQGLSRLNHILTAMSEAKRLEESIHSHPRAPLDLVPLLREVVEAYRALYSKHRLTLLIEPATALTAGNPELLVQALDKLLDNAASFAPPGGLIRIALEGDGEHWALSVSNEGPTLPEELAGRLFEPMVSLRPGAGGQAPHMGLGLHIVRLVSEFFGGQASAENLADGSGVRVVLTLPNLEPN